MEPDLREQRADGELEIREDGGAEPLVALEHAAAVEAGFLEDEDRHRQRARVHEPVLANAVALVDGLLLSPIARGGATGEDLDDEIRNDAQELSFDRRGSRLPAPGRH